MSTTAIPRRARDLGQDRVVRRDPRPSVRRVAVVGAGRGDRVVRRRDDEDSVRSETTEEVVEDRLHVRSVALGGHALDDVVHPDKEGHELGSEPIELWELGPDHVAGRPAVHGQVPDQVEPGSARSGARRQLIRPASAPTSLICTVTERLRRSRSTDGSDRVRSPPRRDIAGGRAPSRCIVPMPATRSAIRHPPIPGPGYPPVDARPTEGPARRPGHRPPAGRRPSSAPLPRPGPRPDRSTSTGSGAGSTGASPVSASSPRPSTWS